MESFQSPNRPFCTSLRWYTMPAENFFLYPSFLDLDHTVREQPRPTTREEILLFQAHDMMGVSSSGSLTGQIMTNKIMTMDGFGLLLWQKERKKKKMCHTCTAYNIDRQIKQAYSVYLTSNFLFSVSEWN